MYYYTFENLVKQGRMEDMRKIFIQEGQNCISTSDYVPLLIRAIDLSRVQFVIYFLLGEDLYQTYKSGDADLDTLAVSALLQNRNCFDIPDLVDKCAMADSVGILKVLKAFNYPVENLDAIHTYCTHKSFTILSHLSKRKDLRPAFARMQASHHYCFEINHLIRMWNPNATLPASVNTSCHDVRQKRFEEGSMNCLTVDNLSAAIEQENIQEFSYVIQNIQPPSQKIQEELLLTAIPSKNTFFLESLLAAGYRPQSLISLLKRSYYLNNNSSVLLILLKALGKELKELLKNKPKLDHLLPIGFIDVQVLDFIFTSGILECKLQYLYEILNGIKPIDVPSYLIACHAMGFSVKEFDTKLISSKTAQTNAKLILPLLNAAHV